MMYEGIPFIWGAGGAQDILPRNVQINMETYDWGHYNFIFPIKIRR